MGQFAKAVQNINSKFPDTFPDWKPASVRKDVPHIATGVLVFDIQTGIGGFPRGMLIELFGPESCGKTTLALETAREVQQEYKQSVLYLDYAHDFDPRYAVKLGVNLDENWWALNQPNTLEDGMRLAENLMTSSGGELGLVIVDDVASMNPAQNAEKEIGESVISAKARAIGLCLEQTRHLISTSQVAMVFINQLRDVINIDPFGARGAKKTTTPGGRALKFYAGMRVEFSQQVIESVKEGTLLSKYEQKKMTGQRSRFQIIKNKKFRPYTQGEVYLKPGKGFDSITSCVEIMERMGTLRKNGSHYHLGQPYCLDDRLEQTFHGFDAAVEFFEQNPNKTALMAAEVTRVLQATLEIP